MFIKKLLINGFKSFADKTLIEFKDGVNVIIGPNGCGKSNIIDAIRWVMGEQRLKTLRAGKSEDIIFGGSADRPSSSYAQVSFYINNDPKILHSDFPEVEITRKLFRSGESIYQTNKNDCRLKDIHHLFMDTGLGKGSYSIIQQGQIDQILSSKPDERRLIFEEAAGIARSKVLVKESTQKLEKTEENLARLYDILSEVEKQMKVLQKQAEQAQEYKTLKEFIFKTDQKIFFSRFSGIKRVIEESESKGKAFQEKMESMREEMAGVYADIDSIIEKINLSEEKLEDFREEEKNLEIEEHKISQEIQFMRNEHDRLKKEAEKVQKHKESLERQKEESYVLLSSYEEEEIKLAEDLAEYEYRHDELTAQLLELEETLSELSSRILAMRKENQEMDQEISSILNDQKSVFRKLITSIEQKRGIISRTLKDKNTFKEKISHTLTHLDGFFKKWDFFLETGNPDEKYFQEMTLDLKRFKENIHTFKNDFYQYESSVQEILDFFEKDGKVVFNEEYEYRIQSLRTKVEMNTREIFHLEQELENKRKSRDTVIRVQNENEIQMNRLQEKQVALLSEKERLQRESETLSESIARTESETVDLQDQMETIESDVFEMIDRYEIIRNKKNRLEDEKQQYHREVMEKTKELKEKENYQRNLSSEIESMTKRLDKIVFQYKENIMKQDMLKDNFLEKYGKNIEDLYSDELVEEIDENELDMEIRRSREKLNNMGPVNLLAIDEYEEVRSRFEFLDQNRQDMENAKEDLQNLIHEVYSQATESFTEAFNQIEKNLEVVFKKAFGGGKCHLKLEDPKAPLESGIEIIAQPPGKKLQSIALLSGGERTMVAMSIMFAIFMTKPSPFCLLDEVDAALDEANIERFANIINEFSHNTQFIIITHNRITAQRGDIFYGVTMQEPGITKVFSFKPDNLDNENIA